MSRIGSIYLVGPMGAGKSAVGRQLARMLGLTFYDSDEEVEKRTGVDISFIFEKEGEDGFRRRERQMIAELTTLDDIVLATGGGAVLEPENRRLMASRGTVVYLQASVEQQTARTRAGRERPLLSTGEPEDVLRRLMAEREPLYQEVADLTVSTDGRKVMAVARELEQRLRRGPDEAQ